MNSLPFHLQVFLVVVCAPAVAGFVLALLHAPHNKE
jgi:hypothetical protein